MNYKKAETDSGSYVNGIYTTKNGYSGLGLNCPKGTRLYDTRIEQPIFFMPEDREPGEVYEFLTQEVAPGVMPYYAISNHGHLMNIKTGQVMKENFRPNGYSYFCLAAEGGKTGQKKYSTSRMVMKTFDPREDADQLQVNHKNGDKSQNYFNKLMEDGSCESNLEWNTPKENIIHSHSTGLNNGMVLDVEKAKHIRELRNQGYTYSKIQQEFYPNVSSTSIQNICTNRTYYDPEYKPLEPKQNYSYFNLSKRDAKIIRNLHGMGLNYREIKEKFFPEVSITTISNIITGNSHNEEPEVRA